jgi:hypothetical protein
MSMGFRAVVVALLASAVGVPTAARASRASLSDQAPPPTGPATITQVLCSVEPPGQSTDYSLDQRHTADGRSQWVLSLLERVPGEPAPRNVSIVLKGAKPPVRGGDGVTFNYRSPHGGYIVEIHATATRSTIDVFVSHGLEVNVEPDLSPDVDRLNTDGKRAARCRVSAER